MNGDARTAAARRGVLTRFLDAVEFVGNRLPDQVTIFVLLAVAVLIVSWICAALDVSVSHPQRDETIRAYNLLSREGIQWIFTSAVRNFTGFPPLGVVLVALIGVGVAEKVGLFAALLKALIAAVPRWAVTPTIVFAGILSNVASDAGYVILPPLAAMLYASFGRHPLAGVAAAFAGVAGGFSANLLPSTLDPMLAGLTQDASHALAADYSVNALCNYYFMVASTFLLTLVGWVVSVVVVEPRFGPWPPPSGAAAPQVASDVVIDATVSPGERRGLAWSAVAVLIVLALTLLLVVPREGVLRDPSKEGVQQYGPFLNSLVPLIALLFLLPGLAYGWVTRQVRSDRDATRMMSQTMATMGHYIVIAFFAAQFIEWFKRSRLDFILATEGAVLLQSIHLTGAPLMLAFVVAVAIFNVLVSSASAKWTMLAPIFVPMFMLLGKSPETTQALYRVGDSCTNIITPLNVYFPILLATCHRYQPAAGMGTLIAAMVPYSFAFLAMWAVLLLVWVALGAPLGPDAPLLYSAP